MTSVHVSDPFSSGMFPVCPASHDVGVRRLFDLSTLLLLLDCRPGDRVLDIGAGPGFASEMMARLGYDVIAIDPDHETLVHNRRRPACDQGRIEGTVRVARAMAEHLPFADSSFDGALGMNVMHHVGGLAAATAELHRILKPGSRAVFCEPGVDHLQSPETQRAIVEHGEDDKPFDVLAFLRMALDIGFADAMLTATLQPSLRLLPVQEVVLFVSGCHPRPTMTPAGVVDELYRHHAYAILNRGGERPKTSRFPGLLRGRVAATGVPRQVVAGRTLTVPVRVENTGDSLWLSRPSKFGGFVTLGCKILRRDGSLVANNLTRTFFDRDVPPGASVETVMAIEFPDSLAAGVYVIKCDLIDELVCWFSDLDPESPSTHTVEVQ